ncbi:MAG: hypothetical protein LBV18_05830 [Alistipes sp.]|jgi:hypothetical protein|nr:hypothetical protein [Alistipes sp.]
MKTFWQLIASLAVLAAVFFAGRCSRPAATISVLERVDTIVKRDTIRETVFIPKIRYAHRVDTVYLSAPGDTVQIAVEVPIERKVYKTSDYRAEIEGYKPALVSMEVYRQTLTVTETRTVPVPDRRRWGLGIQAGYGAGLRDGRIVGAPYVGIGVSYDIFTW